MKLKTFRTIQKVLAMMGFTPNQQQSNHCKLNSRQIIFVVVCAINVTFLSSYIVRVANSIDEYMDAIFSLIILVTVAIAFISIIFKNDKLFNYIEFITNLLTDSKCAHYLRFYWIFEGKKKQNTFQNQRKTQHHEHYTRKPIVV